jgi:inosose dehydratase
MLELDRAGEKDPAPRLAASQELWAGPFGRGQVTLTTPHLVEAQRWSYRGLEIDPMLHADKAELGAQLADHGLMVAATPFLGGLQELTVDAERARLGPTLQRGLSLGGDLIAYTDFTVDLRGDETRALRDRPRLRRDDLRRYGEKLTRLADWVATEGGTLAYLARLGTLIEGPDEMDLLLASSDVTVGLALDLGPVLLAGGDPVELISRYGSRLRLVRCQRLEQESAARAQAEGWSFPRLAREAVLGPGDEDPESLETEALGRALAAVDYHGWLVAAADRFPGKREVAADVELAHGLLLKIQAAQAEARRSKAASGRGRSP